MYANEDVAEYNVTNLNNGFTVLTESQIFPGSVHMGKLSLLSGGWNDEAAACGRAFGRSLFSLILINFGSFVLNRLPD